MEPENETIPENLLKSLNDIANDENFENYTIKSHLLPPDGGSFMGILREITIEGQTKTGPKKMELFVKSMKPGAVLTIYSVTGVYERETKIHRDIFKMIRELQDEANIPFEDRFNMPKSFLCVDSYHIIMENLTRKGYTMCERLKVMQLKFAELTIQQIAKFHGMAFVIQEKRPDFFKTDVETLSQPYYYNTPDWNSFVSNISRLAATVLDPEAKKKVENYLPTTFEKYNKYADDSTTVRTFIHGDFRANNVMAKLNNNEITEVMLLDFQQSFYGCPIIDFLYFIYSGTDQEYRRQHLENLKSLYHDTMAQFLKHFGVDINDHFPRKEFERLLKERLDYGLMITLWLIPTVLADKGDIPDVTTVDLNQFSFKINDIVKHRVRGAVDEFIKLGYL